MVRFAVEYSVESKSYGYIHAAGCQDLKDAGEFECEPTVDAIAEAADEEGCGLMDTYPLSPCARKLVQK